MSTECSPRACSCFIIVSSGIRRRDPRPRLLPSEDLAIRRITPQELMPPRNLERRSDPERSGCQRRTRKTLVYPRCILCLRAVNCVRLSRVTSINTYIDARARARAERRRTRPRWRRAKRSRRRRRSWRWRRRAGRSEIERPFIIIQPARLTSINIYRRLCASAVHASEMRN